VLFTFVPGTNRGGPPAEPDRSLTPSSFDLVGTGGGKEAAGLALDEAPTLCRRGWLIRLGMLPLPPDILAAKVFISSAISKFSSAFSVFSATTRFFST
jgi:hypothetical protein